jgi:hypothetical protein
VPNFLVDVSACGIFWVTCEGESEVSEVGEFESEVGDMSPSLEEASGVEPGSDVRGLEVEVVHWLSDMLGLSAKFGAAVFLVMVAGEVCEASEGLEEMM